MADDFAKPDVVMVQMYEPLATVRLKSSLPLQRMALEPAQFVSAFTSVLTSPPRRLYTARFTFATSGRLYRIVVPADRIEETACNPNELERDCAGVSSVEVAWRPSHALPGFWLS
jgi:hypothetical protein